MRGDLYRLKAARDAVGHEQAGPRYAVVLQSDDLPLSTWVVAPTSTGRRAASFRPEIEIDGVKGGAPAGEKFIEGAQFMSHLVNIGDTRTLISHPATTTHRLLDEAQQRAAGVLPDMVRISVGLEHIDDILWDIDQALARAGA